MDIFERELFRGALEECKKETVELRNKVRRRDRVIAVLQRRDAERN